MRSFLVILTLITTSITLADTVVIPNTLSNGTVADSGMVHQVGDSFMSVRYNDLIAPLIKSVQELSVENTMLKAELAEIKAMLLANANNNRGSYDSTSE